MSTNHAAHFRPSSEGIALSPTHLMEPYLLPYENAYCSSPDQCLNAEVLMLGSGIGLSSVRYLQYLARQILGRPLRIVVADAGPFDLYTHMAHTKLPRRLIIEAGMERLGGKLLLWGMSTPRPPENVLRQWPYPYEGLFRRFKSVEAEMGVPDRIPMSGRHLESGLQDLLATQFPQWRTRTAPLAIDRDGHRWCPIDDVPDLVQDGVLLLPRFRCTRLETADGRVIAVHGLWKDGQSWVLRPNVVVLGVGVEASLPLLRPIVGNSVPIEAADHHRIDAHGSLDGNAFGRHSVDDLGVAVLLMECWGREYNIPYHLEIKVAPRDLWSRGYMPSGDNLRSARKDTSLWVQIQAIAAMHDRFPTTDLLNIANALPPVMSVRDAAFHGEIVESMRQVASALGLSEPMFNLRPLLANHHLYGAFRVGNAVGTDFRFCDPTNLFVLPPTAFVDVDDDANPTLKSRVLAQYAMDAIIADFASLDMQDTSCHAIARNSGGSRELSAAV